jgi:GT2 family glycosyltransferase
MSKTIAILITSYNRIDFTSKCVKNLLDFDINLDIFLVDDNSTDGTSSFILQNYPQVNLIKGSGNLFWTRGMNKAWKEASNYNYDYYVWLNDDVFLSSNAFSEIFEVSSIYDNKSIISGIIQSNNGEILYGGSDVNKVLIKPNGKPQNIKYLNGNFVLIPKVVFETIGFFDEVFHHDLGDVDYGLQAQLKKIEVKSTRHAIGIGSENNICRIRKNNSNIFKRFKHLNKPLGSPLQIIFFFQKKNYGLLKAILTVSFVCFLNIISDKLNNLLFGKKYI